MISGARRTAALILLAVLLVGFACGVVLEEVVDDLAGTTSQSDRGAAPAPKLQAEHPMSGGAEEEFLESLGLSGALDEAVEQLLDERENQLEAYWTGKLPEIEALIDSNRAAIRSLLPPDRRAAYDRWVAGQRTRVTGE